MVKYNVMLYGNLLQGRTHGLIRNVCVTLSWETTVVYDL